jgi:protein TonB
VLSIAIHGAALYSKNIYTPPEPRFDSGRTVLQLTLLPSIASRATSPEPATEPESLPVPDPQPVATPQPEPQPTAEEKTADSAEQDASLVKDKGVISDARASSSIQPAYPRISRLRGEEGVVTLSIHVLASGKAERVDVIQSSGFRRLDEAACKAARKASFSPARQFGRTIDSTTELSFTFRLTDD